MRIYTFSQSYNILRLLYAIKSFTKCDVSALYRSPFPCIPLIAVLHFCSTKEQEFFIAFLAIGLKIFLLAFLISAFTSLVLKKSVSSFVYIFFSSLWTFSFSPRWKCMKFYFSEQVYFFFPNSLLNNFSNGGKGNPAEMLTNIWLMVLPISLAFMCCVLAFKRRMKYDIRPWNSMLLNCCLYSEYFCTSASSVRVQPKGYHNMLC